MPFLIINSVSTEFRVFYISILKKDFFRLYALLIFVLYILYSNEHLSETFCLHNSRKICICTIYFEMIIITLWNKIFAKL